MMLSKMFYNSKSYNFYPDHFEITRGFLISRKINISYNLIYQITLEQDLIQKFFNLGNIFISTSPTNIQLNQTEVYPEGALMIDIKNPEEIYNKILQITKNN